MNANDVVLVLLGALAFVGVLALARLGLRGADLRFERSSLLDCPRDGRAALVTLVQHARTGQVKQLCSCSLLGSEPGRACEADCARLVNLGLRVLPAHG